VVFTISAPPIHHIRSRYLGSPDRGRVQFCPPGQFGWFSCGDGLGKSCLDQLRKFVYFDRQRFECSYGETYRLGREFVFTVVDRGNTIREPRGDDDLHRDSDRRDKQCHRSRYGDC
jgi:hypothetical protein